MNHLRSNKDIGKTKRARSRTHGGDRKARPVTNHDGRRTRGVWGSDRREDTGMWGGVEGGTRVGDQLGADWRHPPHGAEGLRQCGLVPPPRPGRLLAGWSGQCPERRDQGSSSGEHGRRLGPRTRARDGLDGRGVRGGRDSLRSGERGSGPRVVPGRVGLGGVRSGEGGDGPRGLGGVRGGRDGGHKGGGDDLSLRGGRDGGLRGVRGGKGGSGAVGSRGCSGSSRGGAHEGGRDGRDALVLPGEGSRAYSLLSRRSLRLGGEEGRSESGVGLLPKEGSGGERRIHGRHPELGPRGIGGGGLLPGGDGGAVGGLRGGRRPCNPRTRASRGCVGQGALLGVGGGRSRGLRGRRIGPGRRWEHRSVPTPRGLHASCARSSRIGARGRQVDERGDGRRLEQRTGPARHLEQRIGPARGPGGAQSSAGRRRPRGARIRVRGPATGPQRDARSPSAHGPDSPRRGDTGAGEGREGRKGWLRRPAACHLTGGGGSSRRRRRSAGAAGRGRGGGRREREGRRYRQEQSKGP
ncbi:hypothetical protein PVAP13_3NG209071 [Panicum virgatum]|uniref:Uncharacterized protein n=1 Tax=Panicum virgatum TaxID=38727 RepID=A0A8T0U8W4_PANVG|nr:hypothetical protein PVAP13_3NG209071 [Panicum virgatum]